MALTNINGLVPLRQYYQEFNSSGTWTCPTGTTLVDVLLVGGGGGGGAVHSAVPNHMGAAGGGGGGEVKKVSVPVTAGTTYTVTVGAGGSGSTVANSTPVSGGNGGDSSFGLTRTIANAHYYNHEYAMQLSNYSNNTTNTNAFVQPGGWFSKQANSGSLASPPAYNAANGSSTTMANWIGTTVNAAAITAANVPTGFNGYGYHSQCNATANAYSDLCNWVAVSPSTQYTASAWTYTGSINTAIRIEWYQAFQGTFISASSSTTYSTSTTWGQLTVTATSPANATFALVRYQGVANGSTTGQAIWINQQFEPGATATEYKGPFTNGTWTQTGISNVTGGAIAAGGGGGASIDPNGSGSVPGIGGGGAAFSTSGTQYFVIGGPGSGMGSPVVPANFRVISIQTVYSLSPSVIVPPPTHPTTGRGGSGMVWYQNNMGAWITAGAASHGVDGYGGGGAGGIGMFSGVSINQIEPHYIAGEAGGGGYCPASTYSASGSHAVANSGCGGGGGAASNIAQTTPAKGGNGGSGKVIISYWGY